jgi:hypothetical protein
MVSTDNVDARFEVSAFSIDGKLKAKPGRIPNRAGGAMHSISPWYDELMALDPFFGIGALVALAQRCCIAKFIGIELDEEYLATAEERVGITASGAL